MTTLLFGKFKYKLFTLAVSKTKIPNFIRIKNGVEREKSL
jgi:hypothetical protein